MSDFKSAAEFTRWLMGEQMGEATIRAWKWLWSNPPASAPTTEGSTIDDLERLLVSMQSQLQTISPIIDRVRAETSEIGRQHGAKELYHRELILKVLHAKQCSNIDEARLLMAKVVQVERILPELKVRRERSQQRLNELVEFQERKEAELSLLSFDLRSVKTQIEINRSIDRHLQTSPDLTALFGRFQQLGDRTDDLYREMQAMSQIDLTSNCSIADTVNLQDLDERIDLLLADRRNQGFPA